MERRPVTNHTEYGFRQSPEGRITWTHEDAARRICFDFNFTLMVRDVSSPRVVPQRVSPPALKQWVQRYLIADDPHPQLSRLDEMDARA